MGGRVKAEDEAGQDELPERGEVLPLATYLYYATTHSSAGSAPRGIVYG